jgi:uncharacterized protein
MWPFNTKQTPVTDVATDPKKRGMYSHDLGPLVPAKHFNVDFPQPTGGAAMDESIGERFPLKGTWGGIPEAVGSWYAAQSFIGYQYCAMIAQHWLVDKACSMPAKDAIRQGYAVDCETPEGMEEKAASLLANKASDMIGRVDRRMGIKKTLREFIQFGRVYGVRVALFVVESTDPDYYKTPFNIDGVGHGMYKGISQIDPQWIVPQLAESNINDPMGLGFYEPEFYSVRGQMIHRSHLCVYIPYPVVDFLKASYQFGGVSVPQRIYERVYASERTANEAPILAMTKRLVSFQASEGADMAQVRDNLGQMVEMRDNQGVYAHGPGESFTSMDTTLADMDALIMTQYQLDAAICEVPATKLLGTSPKGFGASGEYEEASYREFLEGIQQDVQPLLERHHELVMKSEVAPKLGVAPMIVDMQWAALDSPTAAEFAAIELQKAQTAQIYVTLGAIDAMDVRAKLQADKDSDFFNLADIEEEEVEPEGAADPLAEPVATPEETPLT